MFIQYRLTLNIADGGDFKALLPNHCTKLNSSSNAQLWHVCPTIGNILLAAVKFQTMDELLKDKFKIVNNSRHDCELMCYVNIDKNILVRIQCWSEGPTEDFDGNYETQYDDAGIELNKENAIRLRDELDRLIKSNYCPTPNETCLNSEVCESQGFCSRCD